MNINLVYVGIDAIAIVLMFLVAIRFFRESQQTRLAWIVLVIAVGAASYVLSSRQDYGVLIEEAFRADFGWWHPVMNLLRNATTAFFMLLCHTIFNDGRKLPKYLIWLLVLQLFLEEPLDWLVGSEWAGPTLSTFIFEAIPAAIQLVFVGFALYWILRERDADLDPNRRKVRVFLLVAYCVQVFLSLGVERIAMGFGWIPWQFHYPIHVVLVSVGAIVSMIILVSPSTALTLDVPKRLPRQTDEPEDQRDQLDAARIKTALEDEQWFHQPGLTVNELAKQLALPEYRLRNLIHHHMGFRNFNALLHHYRVQEVAAALADPVRNATPVLTLALTAGYQSINPFNRAFRELKGMTPTEFRRQSQQAGASEQHTNNSNSTPESGIGEN